MRRFLASAVELEDNTTYTDRWGADHFKPAVQDGHGISSAAASDVTVKAQGNDFIAR